MAKASYDEWNLMGGKSINQHIKIDGESNLSVSMK